MNNISEPSVKKEERREQKRVVQNAEMRSAHYKKIGKRITYWILGLAIVFGGGWWAVARSLPKGEDLSAAVEVLKREHIAEGTSYTGYNSNPPTSGPHYPNPAEAGFYDRALPDEQIVHNLEHGNIWIAYKPDVSPEVIKQIRKLAGATVVASPRSQNEKDIAVAAWGRLDVFNLENGVLTTERIKDFIFRYANKGPERIGAGIHSR